MKRRLRVYKKTVSIVNETATGMYESLVGDKKGFLLESYDKNYDRYTFFGKEPEEIISSRGNALVITKNDGTQEVRNGNPLERLRITKNYLFPVDWLEILDMILCDMQKCFQITIRMRSESKQYR